MGYYSDVGIGITLLPNKAYKVYDHDEIEKIKFLLKSPNEDNIIFVKEMLKHHDIETRTIDGLNLRRVDLIKIDTEGCELLVLKGAQELIKKCHPDILCEYWEPNTKQFGYHPSEITKLLVSHGYKYTRVGKEDLFFYIPV